MAYDEIAKYELTLIQQEFQLKLMLREIENRLDEMQEFRREVLRPLMGLEEEND